MFIMKTLLFTAEFDPQHANYITNYNLNSTVKNVSKSVIHMHKITYHIKL